MADELVRQLKQSLQPGKLSDRVKQKQAEARRFLVVDCSGSTAEHVEPGRAKIDGIRDIVTMLRNDGVGFRQIIFGGDVALSDVIPDPDGGTPMAEALDLARLHQAERVVLISDGMPDDERDARRAAKQLQCPIDIFYVGPRPHPGEAFLRSLAQKSGGQYQATALTLEGARALADKAKARLALPRP